MAQGLRRGVAEHEHGVAVALQSRAGQRGVARTAAQQRSAVLLLRIGR